MTPHATVTPSPAGPTTPIVNSYTEWEPLEEVIVGRADHAFIPRWHCSIEATMPKRHWSWFQAHGGSPFPAEVTAAAARELDAFSMMLEREGIKVRRPDPVDWSLPFQTPDFGPETGLYGAMPRDSLIVFGTEIVEAPMAWRSRYFEFRCFRSLLKEYFQAGARWTMAPRPQLSEASFNDGTDARPYDVQAGRSAVTEFEPVFDAADFCRVGRDVFCQLSQVTNRFGVAWLARHLEPTFRVHILEVTDPNAMHIDASFIPLAPGRLLRNPERIQHLPDMFRDWEILTPPPPAIPEEHPLYFTSRWLSLNVLSLDERRVVVEAGETPTIDFLKQNGFEPIPVPFRNFCSMGGAFHCATCDIRRRGTLQSYF